jgi:hypothetical protein
MSQTAKAQEPSMEEILASIRRIIADDEGKPAKAAEPAPPPPKPQVAAAPSRPAPPPIVNTQSEVDAMLAGAEPPKPAPKPEPRAEPKPAPSDVLDLTEANVAAKPPPAPGPAPNFRTIDGDTDVVFTDRAPEPLPEPPRFAEEMQRKPAPPPPTSAPPGMAGPAMPDRALLSNNAAASVDSAFNALAATVLGQNARTLEDLVKEMLRPMLKSWLDDNLPNLVERIVRAEIERVSRGR